MAVGIITTTSKKSFTYTSTKTFYIIAGSFVLLFFVVDSEKKIPKKLLKILFFSLAFFVCDTKSPASPKPGRALPRVQARKNVFEQVSSANECECMLCLMLTSSSSPQESTAPGSDTQETALVNSVGGLASSALSVAASGSLSPRFQRAAVDVDGRKPRMALGTARHRGLSPARSPVRCRSC